MGWNETTNQKQIQPLHCMEGHNLGCLFWILFGVPKSHDDTVDGRNPAPLGMYKTL